MKHHHTVEIAALISAYSPHLLERRTRLPAGKLERYWDRSKRRLHLWLSAISNYQSRYLEVSPQERLHLWHDLEPVLEEIFVSEILTRIWGSILVALDQESGSHDYEPIARNVLLGHLDARRRALQLLVSDSSIAIEDLSGVDRLRRRVERWTDLLLGHLTEKYPIQDFAFDTVRSQEFGTQQLLQSAERPRDQVWGLLLVGLRMAFPVRQETMAPPNELIQHEITGAILSCYPADCFDNNGPFRSLLNSRKSINNSSTDKSSRVTSSAKSPRGQTTQTEIQEPLHRPGVDQIRFQDYREKFRGTN